MLIKFTFVLFFIISYYLIFTQSTFKRWKTYSHIRRQPFRCQFKLNWLLEALVLQETSAIDPLQWISRLTQWDLMPVRKVQFSSLLLVLIWIRSKVYHKWVPNSKIWWRFNQCKLIPTPPNLLHWCQLRACHNNRLNFPIFLMLKDKLSKKMHQHRLMPFRSNSKAN